MWAILGLTCGLVLFLNEEAAEALARRFGGSPAAPMATRRGSWRRADRVAVAFVAVLALATSRHVPVFGALNVPAYAALWTVGVAQDYRLFNWIDRVAYKVRTRVDVTGPDGRRQAAWFCRFVEEPGTRVEMISTVHPIRPDNLDFSEYRALRLAEFECVPPGSVTEEEGGVPVPEGWPHLQARLLQGLNPLPEKASQG